MATRLWRGADVRELTPMWDMATTSEGWPLEWLFQAMECQAATLYTETIYGQDPT